MDSEHRHELEENALATWLERTVENLKPQLPAIGAAVVLGVAGLVGWTSWSAANVDAREGEWRSYTLAIDGGRPSLGALKQTAEAYPGTPVEEWSEITWADGQLWTAASQFLTNRAAADEQLEQAKAVYERLAGAENGEIADRAAYGLARVLEMQGDLEAAREQYTRVSGPFAEIAAERAEQLGQERLADDYRWLTSVASDAPAEDAAESEAEDEASLDDLLERFAEPVSGDDAGDGVEDDAAADAEAPDPDEEAATPDATPAE